MDKNEELLTRGVEKIYPSKESLEKVLRSGKKITVYNGIDPTGPFLHLGHMVILRKLRQFQDLGHKVILLIGDFTGMIGDPSGKSKARVPMTKKEVLENARTYKIQASKILNFEGKNPVEINYNSQWLDKLSFEKLLRLASLTTYAQIIERDMFQKRIKEGKDIFLNELLYPLMQGYDSVVMNVDLEVGGSDQTFNMLMGRTLMKKIKGKEKFVLATFLLAEPGKVKMGKTEGNLIPLEEKPERMFGAIMAWPDSMIKPAFSLLTDIPLDDIKKIVGPMEQKKRLAFEIVAKLNSKEVAMRAQEEFERVFQKGKEPLYDILIYDIKPGQKNIVDLLLETKLAISRSEAKRLVKQGAVEINKFKVQSSKFKVEVKDGMIIKVGKRKFAKFNVKT